MSKDEALKLALEAFGEIAWSNETQWQRDRAKKAITTLKQALEQTEPEPVECHTCKGLGRIYMGCGSWIHCDTCNTTGKATTPPKRRPLTDEEIADLWSAQIFHIVDLKLAKDFVRDIEAAHGIKENT